MTTIAPPRASGPPQATATPAAPTPAAGAARPAGGGAAEVEIAGGAVRPNPALRMDPELGLVVLEFRDRRGRVATTIPTSRELEAYRQAVRAGAPRPEP